MHGQREMRKMREIEIEKEGSWFNERMKRAQEAFTDKNWRDFKKIFEQDKRDLLEDFDLFGNTAISVAPRSDNPKLLGDLLEMLPEEARWDALRKQNFQGNTLLHEVALREEVKMVDIVLEFEKKAAPPPLSEEEEDDNSKEQRGLLLLELKNLGGETPLFRAAKFGRLKMLKHMAKILHAAERDMKIQLHNNRHSNILHASVLGQFFDVAIWIIMRMDGSTLALEKNEDELTCLQLLSRMPQCFQSHNTMGCWKKLLYYLLPEKGYEFEDCDNFESFRRKRDLESGQQDDARPPTLDLSRINYALWKYLAKAIRSGACLTNMSIVSKRIDKSWKENNKQKLAKRLAESLVKNDYSWKKRYKYARKTIDVPPVIYNVRRRKARMERMEKWQQKQEYFEGDKEKQKDPYFDYPSLLVAASNGITEIVKLFLREHPAAINYMTEDDENMLHIAVKHRQLKIFDLLKKNPEFEALAAQISMKGRTILHQSAMSGYYRAPELAGAAFQLQSELKWFKRVEKVIRKDYIMHCDDKGLTAGDLLDVENDNMLRDAQSWAKETAQSCSTVAVLVATVVFAAAYTIPGGSNAGKPVLLRSPVFIFFTIMDVVALALSLASVVMFLSVLTSPFELWDFHKTLPIRLNIGFAFLFFSLISTMLAFSATILLTIHLPWKEWTSTLVYTAAFFPVSMFAVIQFPFYTKLPILVGKIYKRLVKVVSITRVTKYYFEKVEKTKYP